MAEIEISVIIPVYNVSEYLVKNLEAITMIHYKQIEFIYVNDGSTDNSQEVIESYMKDDSRIKLINRENGGLSEARNTGMINAKGKWICFLDGDDYYDSEAFERFISLRKEDDDILWGDIVPSLNRESVAKEEGIKRGIDWISEKQVDYVAWLYLINRRIIDRNQISFPSGYLHEDMDFVPKIFMASEQVHHVNVPFYNYVIREGSISNRKNIKRSLDLIRIAENLRNYVGQKYSQFTSSMKEYISFLCTDAVNLAVVSDIHIKDVVDCLSHEEMQLIMKILQESGRRRDHFLKWCLEHEHYGFYQSCYKVYRSVRK